MPPESEVAVMDMDGAAAHGGTVAGGPTMSSGMEGDVSGT